jgi:hypothetical protein
MNYRQRDRSGYPAGFFVQLWDQGGHGNPMKTLMMFFCLLTVFSLLAACSLPTWSTYTNTAYGFRLQYPSGGSITSGATDTAIRIQLPIASGTNLSEKYLDIDVQNGVATCQSPLAAGYAPGYLTPVSMTISGLSWVKENAGEGAAGSTFDWTAYSTVSGSVCVSLSFVLHSHNPAIYATPPPTFDLPGESAVFILIVDTFQWLNGSATTPTGVHVYSALNPTVLPVFTLTPSLEPVQSPTSTPSLTPASPLYFNPQVKPLEFNYKPPQWDCRTDISQVDISLGVMGSSEVHGVLLFFRLKNKSTGAETAWNDGLIMTALGNGQFDKVLSAGQIPDLAAISSTGASAWLEIQFVATNLAGGAIGRSPVYANVSLTPCP